MENQNIELKDHRKPKRDAQDIDKLLELIGERDDLYRPNDEYLRGVVDTIVWIYGSKPVFFKPLPMPVGWPWILRAEKMSMDERITRARVLLSSSKAVMDSITSLDAERFHENAREVITYTMTGIVALRDGLELLVKKARGVPA